MNLFFYLSKENISLAQAEIETLTNKKGQLIDELFFVSTNKKNLDKKLAYTRAIYLHLLTCKKDQLITKLQSFYWQKYYKKDFALRLHHSKEFTEKQLAKYIWSSIKNPKVNLKDPTTSFELFFIEDLVVCGKLISKITEPFLSRKPHLKPAHHPSSMSPKLARAIINLTGIQKGSFVDPFCGIGGILVEAGLMGFSVLGYDIDPEMLKKAAINLKHYKIKNYKLRKKDATKIQRKIKYLATDLPYGRGTKKINKKTLYSAFIKNLKKNLSHRAVVIFPHYINYKTIIKQSGLKLKQEFSVYTHHTLTRKIIVLEN